MFEVRMSVVPLTDSALSPVTVSAVPSPSTALPVMVSGFALPVTVPCVLTVEPVRVVGAPSVTASPKVWVPLVRTLPPLMAVVPAASVVRLLSASPAVALPTAPARVVVPLSLIASERAMPSEFKLLPSVMPAPVSVVSAPSVTGPV